MSKKEKDAPENEAQTTNQDGTEEVMDQENAENTTEESSNKKKPSKKGGSKKQQQEELIEEQTLQIGELKDKYVRLLAEFENYKKRTIREKIDLMGTAAQDTMSAILPVLDDFDRAKKNAEDDSNVEPFSEGVMLVYNKLHNVLKQKGLEAMESTGEAFDPELHEAITEIPAPNEVMKGKVIDTVEKGYFLKEKIIRHAKVVVGK